MTPIRSFVYFMLFLQSLGVFINCMRYVVATFSSKLVRYTRKDFYWLLTYLAMCAWACWGLFFAP